MKFKEVFVTEGDAYEIPTEDGIKAVWDFYVDVEAVDGKRYRNYHKFHSGYAADILAHKVSESGSINLDHWFEVYPAPSYALGEVDEVSLMDDEERAYRGV
ncbi:MAG: hypothetical protein R3230_01165 [Nitrosopumilaceae archaeon]|nr:hypothetical protein [Nitrosopumilaceae archaeon]